MINAKEELLEVLKIYHFDIKDVKCIHINLFEWTQDLDEHYYLRAGFTQSELDEFLNSIDHVYDNGYGLEILFGNIWMKDGTWFERHEYDGSEYWEYKKLPSIPKQCLKL